MDERERLAALWSLGILDTPPEDRFDAATRLCAQIFDVPISLISLVDKDRQWFKSRVGLDVKETARDIAFCDHAIRGEELMVVSDAEKDVRFATNPLVTEAPNVRFYAGKVLRGPNGAPLGTLCIMDRQSRELDRAKRDMLKSIGNWVERELAVTAPASADQDLLLRGALEHEVDEYAVLNGEGRIVAVNRAWAAFAAANGGDSNGYMGWNYLEASRSNPRVVAHLEATLAGNPGRFHSTYPCHGPKADRWFALNANRIQWDGPARILVKHENITLDVPGSSQDDSLRKRMFMLLAHELNTPLTPIRMELHRMEHTDDQKAIRDSLVVMRRNLERLSRLADRALAHVQFHENAMRPYASDIEHWSTWIHDAAAKCGVGERIEVELARLPESGVPVDESSVRTVFSALLDNAARFAVHGAIRVSAVAQKGDDGPGWLVTVSDQGVGMTADQVQRLSDETSGAHDDYVPGSGTGLTLSLVARIMAAHGGKFGVASAGEGKGTMVSLWFPALPAAEMARPSRPKRGAKEASGDASPRPLPRR